MSNEEYFALTGGIDHKTPRLLKSPGTLLASSNYEAAPGGYQRIAGIERYDGQPSPSAAQYWVINFTNGVGASAPVAGMLIKGAVATAEIVTVVTSSGNWAAATAGLANTTLDALTSTQLAAYSNIQLDALTSSGIMSLANTQLDGLTSVGLASLAATQLNGLRWESIAGLSNTQLDGLTSTQLASLAGTQLYGLSSAQIAGLTTTQLGSLETSDFGKASGYFVVTNLVGAWVTNEAILTNPGNVTLATSVGTTKLFGASTDDLNDTYLQAAIEQARAKILVVPGSGIMRGAHVYNGDVYAFRDNAGGTACVMHKATAAGWVEKSLGFSIPFTLGGTYEIVDGDTVTGSTSHATGVVGRVIVESGSWATEDAAGRLILTSKTGTFVSEQLRVGVNYSAGLVAAANTTLDALTSAQLAAYAVTQLDALTSSGISSLANTQLDGLTSTGLATLANTQLDGLRWGQLESLANTQLDGLTSTQLSSLAGTQLQGITSSQLSSLSTTQLSALSSSQLGAIYAATTNGVLTTNSLSAGGRYEFINHNFAGSSDNVRMYGVNGVDKAFEFDGTVFVKIITGMTVDAPTHIVEHKNHLILSFAGGSIQNSAIVDPYSWTTRTGASDIGLGEEITGFVSIKNLLAVFGKNKIYAMYGNDSTDWDLRPHSTDSGAIEWSIQQLIQPVMLDVNGVRTFKAAQDYGDMAIGTVSRMIETDLNDYIKRGSTVTASVRSRDKNLYRLFFSDGTGVSVYNPHGETKNDLPQCMFITYTTTYNSRTVLCTAVGEDASGKEVLFFGSTNGYLYQMDKGGSLDGENLHAYFRTTPFHAGSPQTVKRWHRIVVDADTQTSATLNVQCVFDFGISEIPESNFSADIHGGVGTFSESLFLESFFDSPKETFFSSRIDGEGKNISFVISTDSLYDATFTLNGITINFSRRRQTRG